MASSKQIAAVLLAATIGAVLFMPFSSAVTDNTGEVTIDNETAVASVDEPVELDGYNIATDSETVERYNETSSSWEQTASGTDYSIDYEAGTISILDGGSISAGDELRVSYRYQATSGTTTTIVGLLPLFLALLILGSLAGPIMDQM